MKILLVGGGTGGHITPLLAVAHELKKHDPKVVLIGICEKGSAFSAMFKDNPDIDEVYQVRAGKLRRYSGMKWWQKILDIRTLFYNIRDLFYLLAGLIQARKLVKRLRPDGAVLKGGFVGVPVGLAAASLKVPFITHDSDTSPGLANRIVARWARMHATGMPSKYYSYPKDKMVYTGNPLNPAFKQVSAQDQEEYKAQIGLAECKQIITVIGGSQGALNLNRALLASSGKLMQEYPELGIVHIVGAKHEKAAQRRYDNELLADERKRIVVKGFVSDVHIYTGAADIVVSRAGANSTAELAVQAKACIMVPARLAGAHQEKNARHLGADKAVVVVADGDSEGLYKALHALLNDPAQRQQLAKTLHTLAKPHAAAALGAVITEQFRKV